MDLKKVIGWNLRRLRVARGIPQERLALEADIDRSYVGRIERGLENVTAARLEALAKILDVPVAELFKVPDKLTPVPPLRAGRKFGSKSGPRRPKNTSASGRKRGL